MTEVPPKKAAAKPNGAKPSPSATTPPAAFVPHSATLILPMLRTTFYSQRRIDNTLPLREAQTLTDILYGLKHGQAKLRDGRVIESSFDAIRWILEQVGPA